MNNNFEHRFIATEGCKDLANFFSSLSGKGWDSKYHRNIAGIDRECVYYITQGGTLVCGSKLREYTLVSAEIFIMHYKDMLAPIKREEVKEKVYKVTHAAMGKIYNVACDAWQDKLKEWCKDQLFNEELTVPERFVKLMFEASDNNQKVVVQSVFPDYVHRKEIDLKNMNFEGEIFDKDGLAALVNININGYKSFVLNPDYAWELSVSGEGYQTLIPKAKQ
jgi:hypothetical protein